MNETLREIIELDGKFPFIQQNPPIKVTFEEFLNELCEFVETEKVTKLGNKDLNKIISIYLRYIDVITLDKHFDYMKLPNKIFSLRQFSFIESLTISDRLLKMVLKTNEWGRFFNSCRKNKIILKEKIISEMFISYDERGNDFIKFINEFTDIFEINCSFIKTIIQGTGKFHLIFIRKILDMINDVDDELACLLLKNDFDSYKKLVETNKIVPNSKHLEIICESINLFSGSEIIDIFGYILDRKVIPTHTCIDVLANTNVQFRSDVLDYIPKIIDMLTNCGLLLTLDDIKRLSKCKIKIINFEKYGFEVDDELIKICLDNNFFPDYVVMKGFSQKNLQNLFDHCITIADIQNYIRDREVVYDVICLRNACTIKNNCTIIDFLLSKGVKPDLECLKNIIISNGNQEVKTIFGNLE